ncbi:uncharacterized protein BKA55DRAFT_574175 [Fusarium redolens]|uniref:Uncharacterized protein n=1 Tax=Fusarium redolens TaxID=48865 RepID=A0A9P9GP95_FUSRE|nr:uncharacterized protein BKA55DRAFT_574175 [Fusarium redolens]KAH7243229.1 hypothetical protein BKA55DRAFT_574175 [Fusarium redolens]
MPMPCSCRPSSLNPSNLPGTPAPASPHSGPSQGKFSSILSHSLPSYLIQASIRGVVGTVLYCAVLYFPFFVL